MTAFPRLSRLGALVVGLGAGLGTGQAAPQGPAPAAGASCSAEARAQRTPTVIELYTSEGCSSCPPADRFVSSLKGREDLLVLAFHVGYWDRLGWPDRFALSEGTQRQQRWAQQLHNASVYTPQLIVDGQDARRWPSLPARAASAAGAAPPLPLQLRREGEQITARLEAGAARALVGFWAVLEDGHESRVRAGENAGATLRHDHVVRLYQPVPPWNGSQAQQWQLAVAPGLPAYPRRVAFVVSDAATLKPLQALALDLSTTACRAAS